MASAAVVTKMPTSFAYEDLVSHVQTIQNQKIEAMKYLYQRWTNEKNIQNQLQSRSLTIIDPYGNAFVNKYMDHELISTVLKKYKKNYVPKYLHQWIKFGKMDQNNITPLNECELKLTVEKYADSYQFVAYGEVTVWVAHFERSSFRKLVLRVHLFDNMEKIKMKLKERRVITDVKLKICLTDQNTKPNETDWDEGTTFKSEDTIMSRHLYQDNCIIMAKIIHEKV